MVAWCESLITSNIGCRKPWHKIYNRPHHGQCKAELGKFWFRFREVSDSRSKKRPSQDP
jgi:hypothetical protein